MALKAVILQSNSCINKQRNFSDGAWTEQVEHSATSFWWKVLCTKHNHSKHMSNSMKTHHSINYLGFDLNRVIHFFVKPTLVIFHIVIHPNSCRSYSFYVTTGFEKTISTSVTAGLLYRTFCQQLQGQFPWQLYSNLQTGNQPGAFANSFPLQPWLFKFSVC